MIWLIENVLSLGVTKFFVFIMFIASIIGIFLGSFIQIPQLKLIKTVSYCTLVGSIWLSGVLYTADTYGDRLKEARHQIELLESRSAATNVVVQTQVITKIEKVKEYVYANQQFNQQIAKDLDSSCKLTNGAVSVFNASATNQAISPSARDLDGSPSDVKASELLDTVIENNGICYIIREKLIGWQNWYKQQKELYDK